MERHIRFNKLIFSILAVILFISLSFVNFADSIKKNGSKEILKTKLFKKLVKKGIAKERTNSNLTALLFFDPLKSTQKAKLSYAGILQKRYQSKGLQIIGISNKDGEITGNMKEYGDFKLPIIADNLKEIHALFGFQDCCGGTVLLDKKGKIIFLEKRFVDEEVLRQLFEKYLLGTVSYILKEPEKRILFTSGSNLSFLRFRKEWAKEKIGTGDLINKHTVLTFFSYMCSTCKTGGRVKTISKLRKIFETQKIDAAFYLVFVPPFNERDIQEWEHDIKLPFERVFCYSEIYSDEEKYIADNSMRLDPLTVVVNSSSDVIFIEKFGMHDNELIKTIRELKVFSK